MWTTWILSSAVFLALYDICKKASVRDNAVLPVLLISSACGTAAYCTALWVSGEMAAAASATKLQLSLAFAKSAIVGTSWILTFCALRTLPVTIATPIRASAPALVFVAAFFLYGERPSATQGAGMMLVFVGYWAFGWAGRHEGIDFLRSRAVWFAFGGMCMSAVSSLWDKFILQKCAIPVETMQLWFQLGLVAMYALLLAAQMLTRRAGFGCAGAHPFRNGRFEWRWTIPFTGVLLVAADWLYFHGLAIPDVSIAAGSLLRRFSVVITFFLRAALFREGNLRRKGLALASILAGIALICAKGMP